MDSASTADARAASTDEEGNDEEDGASSFAGLAAAAERVVGDVESGRVSGVTSLVSSVFSDGSAAGDLSIFFGSAPAASRAVALLRVVVVVPNFSLLTVDLGLPWYRCVPVDAVVAGCAVLEEEGGGRLCGVEALPLSREAAVPGAVVGAASIGAVAASAGP